MSDDIVEWWSGDWAAQRSRNSWKCHAYSTGDLDDIVSNCIDVQRLFHQTKYSWAKSALADIIQDNRVAQMWDKDLFPPQPAIPSSRRWTSHIEYLCSKNVCSKKRLEKGIIHWATYFAVAKQGCYKCDQCQNITDGYCCQICNSYGSTNLTRAIFNARQWNNASTAGAPCNLARPDIVLSLMADHAWGPMEATEGCGFFTRSFDVKNFFYQVPISEELSRHLGIVCGDLVAHCTKLPMGWHRSVVTACCITAAVILQDVPKGPFHKEIPQGDSPQP